MSSFRISSATTVTVVVVVVVVMVVMVVGQWSGMTRNVSGRVVLPVGRDGNGRSAQEPDSADDGLQGVGRHGNAVRHRGVVDRGALMEGAVVIGVLIPITIGVLFV